MTGVIAAGGEGTRLRPSTEFQNKHTILVYDKPMIAYPLETMRQMGCDDVLICSDEKGIGELTALVKDGSEYGIEVNYAIKNNSKGVPDTLSAAEGHVSGVFPVLCGDVYLDPAPEPQDQITLFWHEFDGAEQHSVWNPETNEIVEKPKTDMGRRAIIAYIFDEQVFDMIRVLETSERGETELADLYRQYLEIGIEMRGYDGFFGDMGTPDGLLRVANHEQERQHG